MDVFDTEVEEEDFLALARAFSYEEGTCLLHSGSRYDSAERSFLCLFPYERVSIQYPTISIRVGVREPEVRHLLEDVWDSLKRKLGGKRSRSPFPEWVGYLGYGMGAFVHKDRPLQYMASGYPDAYFQRSALAFMYDKKKKELGVKVFEEGKAFLDTRQRDLLERLTTAGSWKSFCCHEAMQEDTGELTCHNATILRPSESLDSYRDKVLRAQSLIGSGDIYQVNLSQKTVVSSAVSPFSVFSKLNALNPAPFSAFLSISANHQIVSSSPERFLRLKNGALETRPIKGTAPRSDDAEQDKKNRENLLASEKEKSELLMITDLMRNDLGKVSIGGSVKTEQIWDVESYTNVHHMLSKITSQAKVDLDPLDIIRSCFPGGSITGCPKIRAMEVIADIEEEPRGIYTGSIGYIAGNGDFDFNIAIRTMNFLDGQIEIQLGGAVVADSDPAKEYEETLHKGQSIFSTLLRS